MKKKQPAGQLIYGIHPIIECLKAKKRKLISIYTTKPFPKGFKDIEPHLPAYPYQKQFVTRDVLTNMAGTTEHQSVIAWVHDFQVRKKSFNPEKESFLVMVDGIQDPRNLGAIIRSAYCTGADGVIIPQKGNASITGAVIKASAGLAEHMQIWQPASAIAAVQELSKQGYNLYLAMMDGKKANSFSFALPLCVVIGNEAVGVSKQLISYGTKVTLPQKTKDISYNASVAAGILLFTIGIQLGRIE